MEQERIQSGLQWYQSTCKRIYREEREEFKEDRPRMFCQLCKGRLPFLLFGQPLRLRSLRPWSRVLK